MAVVKSHKRGSAFVSRHFRHLDHEERTEFSPKRRHGQTALTDLTIGQDCPGESDEHLKMKSIAFARLEFDFSDATVELESSVDNRIADVLVSFDDPRKPYGNGIAVEVQYRNRGKDIEGVTDHYLERGYSVAWLDEADFSERDVDLSGMLTVWPYALPDRTGTDGYPDVVRWLWQERSPSVERDIPIPAEYWASFDKSGEWVTIGQRDLRQKGRAWITCSRSPTDQLTLQVGKQEWGWNADTYRVTVQLEESDCAELRSFADTLAENGFGGGRPTADTRDRPWHDLTTAWLAGSSRVTVWLSASLSPDGDVVLALGKKHPKESDRVGVQVDETAISAIRTIADLLEQAFEIENSDSDWIRR